MNMKILAMVYLSNFVMIRSDEKVNTDLTTAYSSSFMGNLTEIVDESKTSSSASEQKGDIFSTATFFIK